MVRSGHLLMNIDQIDNSKDQVCLFIVLMSVCHINFFDMVEYPDNSKIVATNNKANQHLFLFGSWATMPTNRFKILTTMSFRLSICITPFNRHYNKQRRPPLKLKPLKSIALAFSFVELLFTTSVFADGLTADDYMEIQQLYSTYNWAIDSGDAEAYAATFTEDGEFNTFKGQEAIKGFIKRWVEQMGGATRKHWNSNLHITGDGKTAQGKVYLLLIDYATQPASVIASANYADSLVKTKDGWRFTKRTTSSDKAPAK